MSRILIASDSFKNCLSSFAVGDALAVGILKSSQGITCKILPMADGGEGTLLSIAYALPDAVVIDVSAKNAYGNAITASFLWKESDLTAYVEMANVVGLESKAERGFSLMEASSYGLGMVMDAAIKKGARRMLVFVGGSATNDMGIGMAQALGVEFAGKHLSTYLSGRDLLLISDYKLSERLANVELIVATDVDNPLYGNKGASMVYGTQKGGSQKELKEMDQGMQWLAGLIKSRSSIDLQEIAGAGAAGGVAAGMVGFFNARLISGTDIIFQMLSLDKEIRRSDLVITGEGRLDHQSIHGKLIGALSNICRKAETPLLVVCGHSELSKTESIAMGINNVISLSHRNNFLPFTPQSTRSDLIQVGHEIGLKFFNK